MNNISIEQLKEQLLLEEESTAHSISRYRADKLNSNLSDLRPGLKLLHASIEPLSKALTDFKENASARGSGGQRHSTIKLFREMDSDEAAFIISKFLVNSFAMDPVPLQNLAQRVAGALIAHYEYTCFKEQFPGYVYVLEESMKASTLPHKQRVLSLKKNRMNVERKVFSKREKQSIGIISIELFIQHTGLATRERRQFKGKKYLWTVLPTNETIEWLEEAHDKCELLQPLHFPMIVPPKPWTSTRGGGFYSPTATTKLIKTYDSGYLRERDRDKKMRRVYGVVNTLQNVRWRINANVLDILNIVIEDGHEQAGLPSQELEPLPPKTWVEGTEPTPEALKEWKRAANKVYALRISNKSRRIAVRMKQMIAKKFRNHEAIHFVWTMDWRGRVYPLQSHVNPQQDDLGKALLKFADAKPLGRNGMYWMCVHGANCWGVDKLDYNARVQWVNAHEDMIVRCGIAPELHREWMEADEPWQFLAFCFEYERLSQWIQQGRDHEKYESDLPVSLDATCSGLQHFAALLLDPKGGASVNLTKNGAPRDVYQDVADVLIKKVDADAKAGREEAQVWQGKINRKVTKRGVMTTPYGAKKFGLKNQLQAELIKLDPDYLGIDDTFPAIKYLADRLYEAIGEVVVSAREAMDWLQELSRTAAKANKAIKWTTPFGYTVKQEYMRTTLVRISTFFGDCKLKIGLREPTKKINVVRMANGISPNLVHSLDASLLMETVEKCSRAGIKHFAMIHDSFGCHAGNIEQLSTITRWVFVGMYEKDYLKYFRDTLQAQVGDTQELPDAPKRGTLDLSLVLRSPYFFS